ncbi:MAG: hypothetical protein A2V62_09120 [Nitrospirae bacterium RBG_19FT_COMBO_58_9]|nr:MAG: hypothetical protein A2V62_09120 [Nitrospirae bacterium RBG_19FT_COMBO_58_9]
MEGNEAMDSKGVRTHAAGRRVSICVMWIIAVTLAVLEGPAPLVPIVRAQAANAESLAGLEEGEITGVGATTLEVQGRLYHLHPKMTLRDDEGRPMEWKQLRSGMVVQCQLKEGAVYKIIVLLPK